MSIVTVQLLSSQMIFNLCCLDVPLFWSSVSFFQLFYRCMSLFHAHIQISFVLFQFIFDYIRLFLERLLRENVKKRCRNFYYFQLNLLLEVEIYDMNEYRSVVFVYVRWRIHSFWIYTHMLWLLVLVWKKDVGTLVVAIEMRFSGSIQIMRSKYIISSSLHSILFTCF